MQWEEFRFHVGHLSEADQATIERAFAMGAKAHEKQKRKSGEPYFTHPIAVAHILADLGGDRDTIVAGLLHDTVEDTPVTISDIERDFGPSVSNLIDGVTKLESVDVADKPGLNQQIETLRKMFTLMQKDVRIMVIKLADRMHNMQTIQFRSHESQVRIARETMDVYVKIADRLCMRDMQNALESLCLEILEPEMHARLQELRVERESKGQRIVSRMQQLMNQQHPEASKGVTMQYEQKSWYRLREQLKSQNEHVTGQATMAMAVVCENIDQCYRMMGALHGEWQREILSFQDFINSPMINGYRGLHTTIILEDGTRVRCKIRTKEMQMYAHRGISIFCFDSKSKGPLEYLPWTKRIDAIATDTNDRSSEFWEGLQSDILGSTIVVHGPDDRTVMLPSDATALDAVFYLFGEIALRASDLHMNGRSAAFDEQMQNAATVSATFAKTPVATLRWLHSVHTAVASAIIRKHLSAAPLIEKVAVGRELFDIAIQRLMHLRYDEIEPSLFASRVMQRLGLHSADDLFELIAEGKFDAAEAATQLFSDFRKQARSNHVASSWVLRASVPPTLEERVVRTAREYPTLRISTNPMQNATNVVIRLRVTEQQANALDASLASFLAPASWTMRRTTSARALIVSVGVLLALWGLDPVLASQLLKTGMSPYDFTFIRAVTFFAASFVLYAGQLTFSGHRLKWLSPTNPTLMLSGAAMFATALLSYIALSGIAATAYILCIIAGLLFSTLLHELIRKKQWQHTVIALCIIVVGIVLADATLGYTNRAMLAGIGSSFAFALYSELSRRYQRESEAIRARYPAFLFWLSCVGIVLASLILPFVNLTNLPTLHITMAVVFALTFSVLPYSLYFEISRRMDSNFLDRSLPLVTLIAVFGEFALTSSMAPLIVMPVLLLFLAHFYGLYRNKVVTA